MGSYLSKIRLLNAKRLIYDGVVELINVTDSKSVSYLILSHTWGKEEVTFDDLALGPDHVIVAKPARVDSDLQGIGKSHWSSTLRGVKEANPSSSLIQPWKRCIALGLLKGTAHDYIDYGHTDSGDNDTEDSDTEAGVVDAGDPVASEHEYGSRQHQAPKKKLSPHAQSSADSLDGPDGWSIEQSSKPHMKAGWIKVLNTCMLACRTGLQYVWIDTCCIDKTSSAELSEAINSMFVWYHDSALCCVSLDDCNACPENVDTCTKAQIGSCRWLTRGWTLQELIAPGDVLFFDKQWTFLNTKRDLSHSLSEWTHIPWTIFYGRHRNLDKKLFQQSTVGDRMSWAAGRHTTRIEDEAYCMLGLFGVHLPLLYGEGTNAFVRLQEEIIRTSTDHSIFAWEYTESRLSRTWQNRLLAPSPSNFKWHYGRIERSLLGEARSNRSYSMTNDGLSCHLFLDEWRSNQQFDNARTHLDYYLVDKNSDRYRLALCLRHFYTRDHYLYSLPDTENISSFQHPSPITQRLSLISDSAKVQSRVSERYRDRVQLLIKPFQIPLRSSDALLNAPSIAFLIELPLPLTRGEWKVVSAYPEAQYHVFNSSMRLMFRPGMLAAVNLERTGGDGVTVVFGTPARRSILETTSVCNWTSCWLFPRTSELYRLCERCRKFAGNDFFEQTNTRTEGRKSINLPRGGKLSVHFEALFKSKSFLRPTRTVRVIITRTDPAARVWTW